MATVLEPVRIGILGAARVAPDAVVTPARATGSRLTAIAARDTGRARRFAADHGVERVLPGYAEVVADESVDLVYNPLPNSLHTPWNLAAISAGKHVLSEKPFSANAAEAAAVRDAGECAGVVVADGFHYRYHPVTLRLLELVTRGELGDVLDVTAIVVIPRPPAGDLRLSVDLAGGALMDGGCYALHAVSLVSAALDGTATLRGAGGREFPDLPGVDERVEALFELPGGAEGHAVCWMAGDRTELSLTVTGTRATARAENFILPHIDDRLTVTWPGGERVERLGRRSSYTYQLQAVLRAIRYGTPLPTDSSDAVATMGLVDAVYRAASLPPRRSSPVRHVTDR
ncbi:Gfo/Idh/MocA family protein [Phytohabitans kaempferiae]|uniref:Gfo/Idh/MocA family protein n=1 Tax=Phytohabitans kaempferiae TaxID=1620943 RepID=A0ABV6M379_9ACTN